MFRPKTLSISTKLSLGFGFALALIAAVGAIGAGQVRWFDNFTAEIAADWIPEIEAICAIKRVMFEHKLLASRELETTGWRERADILSDLGLADSRLKAAEAEYAGLDLSATEQKLFEQFAAELSSYQRAFGE